MKKLWMAAAIVLAGISAVAAGCVRNAPQHRPADTEQTGSAAGYAEEPAALSPAERLLQGMTVEQKAGQLFLARAPAAEAAAEIRSLQPAGYILFGRDFEGQTPASIRTVLDGYQAAAAIPLLIGVDEEGGTVVRVSRNQAFRDTPFGSPQAVFAAGGLAAVQADTAEKDALLRGLGIHVNLAPVCDLAQKGDYIYPRTLGPDPEKTAAYVRTVVTQMQQDNMGAVLKHFPGYGANGDTHKHSMTDTRGINTYETADFIPFRAGIAAGAGGVLVSHVIAQAFDAALPASLSPAVNRVLRAELGFDGVVMTDDLSMDAVGGYAENGEAAVLAVLAGNDLMITSDLAVQHAAILQAIGDKRLSEGQLDAHVLRVLRWKTQLGLLEAHDTQEAAP